MKNIFNKKNIIIIIVLLVLIGFISFIAKFAMKENEEEKFQLNHIYNVLPEDIRQLYTNTLDISCSGALHLNVKLDGGEYKVSNMDSDDLINYVFGYIDKFSTIRLGLDIEEVNEVTNNLIYGNISLQNKINNYVYDDYVYTYNGGKLTRKDTKCVSDIQYVSDIHGYGYNEDMLSIDINMGYVKDDILYDLSSNVIDEYPTDIDALRKLLIPNSYYRFNYVLENGEYKLYSVEWKSKV